MYREEDNGRNGMDWDKKKQGGGESISPQQRALVKTALCQFLGT